MNINREQLTQRKMKALAIVGQTDQIMRINAVTYKVKSQTSETWYDVVHEYKQGWVCSCPDHIYRKDAEARKARYKGGFDVRIERQNSASNEPNPTSVK